MDHPSPYNCISICAGVGGLDLGVEIARPGAVVVCYVEREAHAAEVLAARMEDGSLSPAPIWSDLATFDPEPWRGVVDCITSGDPCQPNSNAGKMRGEDDDRWLLDHVLRVVEGVRPGRFFRENVPGNANGQLAYIVPPLERMGRRLAAGIFSAEEVGFSHRRERLILMADLPSEGLQGRRPGGSRPEEHEAAERSGRPLADTDGGGRWSQGDAELETEKPDRRNGALADSENAIGGTGERRAQEGARSPRRGRRGSSSRGGTMGHADRSREGAGRLDDGEVAGVSPVEGQDVGSALSRGASGTLGDSASDGRGEGLTEPGVRGRGRDSSIGADSRMGDAALGDVEGAGEREAHRPAEHGEREHRGPGGDVEDAGRPERGPQAQEGHDGDRDHTGRRQTASRPREPGRHVDDPDDGRQRGSEGEICAGRDGVGGAVGPMADTDQLVGGSDAGEFEECEREYDAREFPLGAPGPSDSRWPGILMAAPLRTPSISDLEFAKITLLGETSGVVRALNATEAERVVRRVDARLAYRVDRLRECGNGVSSLAAAFAWRTLEARLGGVD